VKIQRTVDDRMKNSPDRASSALAYEIKEDEVDFARLAAPYRGMFKGPRNFSTREGRGNKNKQCRASKSRTFPGE
jgi:hypothetical protein